MRVVKAILIILLLSITTTSCGKHEITNSGDKQSSLETETINQENFDYGDPEDAVAVVHGVVIDEQLIEKTLTERDFVEGLEILLMEMG